MAVAVVDNAGLLVAFERMDNTQTGGGAGLRILTLRGANAVEGGLPLVVDGRIIGGIGVSGGSAEQDGEVARAAVGALGR